MYPPLDRHKENTIVITEILEEKVGLIFSTCDTVLGPISYNDKELDGRLG